MTKELTKKHKKNCEFLTIFDSSKSSKLYFNKYRLIIKQMG